MEWYLLVLRDYFVFDGRSRRMEYWMFVLINLLVSFAIMLLERLIGLTGVLSGLYALFIFIPSLAVSVRRLHDTEHTGWWMLLLFIPLIGPLVFLYFMVIEGDEGDNEYGPDPQIEDD